jgi:uncharacterized membrane protein
VKLTSAEKFAIERRRRRGRSNLAPTDEALDRIVKESVERVGEEFSRKLAEHEAARSALASPDSGGSDGKASGLAGEPEGGRGR